MSVSAFAPICNPASPECGWGAKAFGSYLSGGAAEGEAHDATLLLRSKGPFPSLGEVLVDQGKQDEFLSDGEIAGPATDGSDGGGGQLRPRSLEGANPNPNPNPNPNANPNPNPNPSPNPNANPNPKQVSCGPAPSRRRRRPSVSRWR